MTYQELIPKLNIRFGNKWLRGYLEKGINLKSEYVILTFIDSAPVTTDDCISYIEERYQLTYYSARFENDIDDFFITNNIIFENKRKVYFEENNVYQNTYDFYILK